MRPYTPFESAAVGELQLVDPGCDGAHLLVGKRAVLHELLRVDGAGVGLLLDGVCLLLVDRAVGDEAGEHETDVCQDPSRAWGGSGRYEAAAAGLCPK